MAEVLEENYMYDYILTLIKCIYVPIQASCNCLKKYTKTVILKARFKKFKTDPCILYRVNEPGNYIAIV